ncbi:ubiquinone biosynthesis protein COQ9, mitochondrial [Tribolium castaneum]|uniref:ubiquinone biosynthesis protein COQ9, mitochondrial n=1 Tax=Tribolium castaneum TaxID=7070 RepID=UPI0000D5590D|nr:PREDICTED: ubiquinone biosynthesis protein COQ9, mitochondrial [Tribolium castaneum]|eukprot:XP_968270.1 PREDICTED: ubiquinone biosynthesis protein COQ9, mitochondrial [Tribolium castaneum]
MSLLGLFTTVRTNIRYTYAAWTAYRKCSSQSSGASQTDCYEDDIKEKILAASLPFVVELGWSRSALGAGAQAVGYPGVTHGLFPRGGADLVLYFQRTSNLKLVEILKEMETKQRESPMPPAVFVEKALQSRLQMIIPYLSRWPQAIAIMSLPPNVPNALATILTAVDDICYYAGDRSVDFNWYARRLGVAGVYKATELYLIQDTSPEYEATWKFLNRRLAEAVQIHETLCKMDLGSAGPKDAVTSAFVTARNILGLNWSR